MINEAILQAGLDLTLEYSHFSQLGQLHRGKVRDSYVQADRRFMVVTDRMSAFDVMVGTIPFKGQILNGLARYWSEESRPIAQNHLIATPDPAVSLVKECQPFPLEIVVRGYLTGSSPTSIWTYYARGERTYCGHHLPEDLYKHSPLPQPLITPTTKAAQGGHDEPLAIAEVLERGLCTAQEFESIAQHCLELFTFGTQKAAERGLILVDTKYELGRTSDGEIIFIDEIHTPDSSRYWYADSYAQAVEHGEDPRPLDKEFLRRRLLETGYQGQGAPPPLSEELRLEICRRYIEIYEQITGQEFLPNLEPPMERIKRNLGYS